jgi:hypothetical protein
MMFVLPTVRLMMFVLSTVRYTMVCSTDSSINDVLFYRQIDTICFVLPAVWLMMLCSTDSSTNDALFDRQFDNLTKYSLLWRLFDKDNLFLTTIRQFSTNPILTFQWVVPDTTFVSTFIKSFCCTYVTTLPLITFSLPTSCSNETRS